MAVQEPQIMEVKQKENFGADQRVQFPGKEDKPNLFAKIVAMAD